MSARMRAGVGFTIVVALTALCATGSAQRRRRREPRPTTPMERVARYESARARWHRAVPTPAGFRGSAGPTVRLRSIHGGHEVALSPLSSGRFSAESLARAESALGDHRNGYRRAIDRRLLDIVYRTAVHFGVPLVHVVSCVRAPRQGSHSNHHLGRAMDFVMPGVSDDRVADHVRRFGFVGVGVYPRSGFVHLDVRDRSFFWVDHSGPGERGRARQVLAELSREVDRRARRDGATPVATTGAPSAIEALMPAAPLLDPDAPEVFDIVANESDVVDPAVDAFEETPSTSVETVTTEVAAVIDPEPPAEPAASEPIEVAEAELVPASGAAADAAEEPIVEPRSMPDVPRRLRWRGRDRAPRAAASRPRRRR